MLEQTISHFDVLEKLGEGGMGVVYKAHDRRLGRPVALKVLTPEAVSDIERRQRFVQEARSASALNHPNIITIYEIEAEGETPFIAMEYLDGRTLADRIGPKGLPTAEALRIAVQVAGALTAAHASGIIHRDLKPANVMVTESGLVKLLDFGLAKLTEPTEDNAGLSTRTVLPRTEEGIVIGTCSYMSPEQAEGRKLDPRSDIFSFGTMLYETVSGRNPFHRDSRVATMAAVLHHEPAPPGGEVPEPFEEIILRCLRKDPAARIQTMAEVKAALENLDLETARSRRLRRSSRRRWMTAAAVILGMVGVGASWFSLHREGAPDGPARLVPLTSYPGSEETPSFSPDGSQVAFSWNGERRDNVDIYLKAVDGGEPVRLTMHPSPDVSPAWSPDGRDIAFVRAGAVFLISPLGGPERKLAVVNAPLQPRVSWTPDGKHLAVQDRESLSEPYAVFLLSAANGEKRRLTRPPDGSVGDHDPAISPDGKTAAFVRWRNTSESDLYIVPLRGGEPQRLTTDNRPILGVAWTPDGRGIVVSSERGGSHRLWRIDTASAPQPPEIVAVGGENAFNPDVSLGGTPARLAYQNSVTVINIWRSDATQPGSPAVQVVASTRRDGSPQISPDGMMIAFISDRTGDLEVWVSDSEGSNAVQVTSFKGPHLGTPRWSPDSAWIAFDSLASGNRDIYVAGLAGGEVRQLTSEPSDDARPSWSADGRWIYFRSDRSGAHQIWKKPSHGGDAMQVTESGGFEGFESHDGRRLYFIKSAAKPGLWSMPVEGGEADLVLASVRQSYWAVANDGIFYADLDEADARSLPVMFYSFSSRRTRRAGAIKKEILPGTPSFTADRDGRWIVWAQVDHRESDLMLVENFR